MPDLCSTRVFDHARRHVAVAIIAVAGGRTQHRRATGRVIARSARDLIEPVVERIRLRLGHSVRGLVAITHRVEAVALVHGGQVGTHQSRALAAQHRSVGVVVARGLSLSGVASILLACRDPVVAEAGRTSTAGARTGGVVGISKTGERGAAYLSSVVTPTSNVAGL